MSDGKTNLSKDIVPNDCIYMLDGQINSKPSIREIYKVPWSI